LQNFASDSFIVSHFLHILSLEEILTIFVDSIKTITVIVDKIVISIGPKNIKKIDINFEIARLGTISQYQTVVIVTTHHHKVAGKEENNSLFHQVKLYSKR
jgi:hypothetical protein